MSAPRRRWFGARVGRELWRLLWRRSYAYRAQRRDGDARWALLPVGGRHPGGHVRLRCTIHAEDLVHRTRLRVSCAGDASTDEPLWLSYPNRGELDSVVRLPEGVTDLAIEAAEQGGCIEVRDVTFTELSFAEVTLRRSLRVYRQLRDRGHSTGAMAGVALGTLRAAGLRGVLHQISHSYLWSDHGEREAGEPACCQDAAAYRRWIAVAEGAPAGRLEAGNEPPPEGPRFDVVIPPADASAEATAGLRESLERQAHPGWRLASPSGLPSSTRPGVGIQSLLAGCGGDFVCFLDPAVRLHEGAFAACARYLSAAPTVDVLYSDHDRIDAAGGRCRPHFKPSWDPDLFLATEYIFPFWVVRRSLLVRVLEDIGADLSEDWRFELAWACARSAGARRVGHLPRVLAHERLDAARSAPSADTLDRRNALLARYPLCDGLELRVAPVPDGTTLRVVPPPGAPLPAVSLLVPTRDRRDLLEPCVTSILEKTTYPDYELIIIDNDSRERDTARFLTEMARRENVRIVSHPGKFNFGAIVNRAADQARGALIGLVNNDTAVINGSWLAEMAFHLLRADVGVVGAKLHFADGTIQHGGVILGIGGVAGHAHRYFDGASEGYEQRLAVTHQLSAVTGACMLVRRDVFERAGGLSEDDLPTDYGDVDFCLRIRRLGYRVLWTPFAGLYHYESKSRGKPDTPTKLAEHARARAYMQRAWGPELADDPFYSPSLTLEHEDFSLAWPPRRSGRAAEDSHGARVEGLG